MIPTLKILKIVFCGEIRPYEIPAFRGAIAQKVGPDQVLFHNHLKNGFRYAYPLIQYKRLGGHPAMICIGAGVDEIYHYFSQQDWSVSISGRTLDMQIQRLDMNQFPMRVWDKSFSYRIRNWIPINQNSLKEYESLQTPAEKIPYLERKLNANILSFAKGIDWHVEKPIETRILNLDNPRMVKVKGVRLMGFTLHFQTNVFLPNDIGLGAKVSLGYGVVHTHHRSPRQQSKSA